MKLTLGVFTGAVKRLLLLPFLLLDCTGNMLLGGSWRNTMSSEAWKHREHRWFGWCHRAIDAIPFFGAGHCEEQAGREDKYGSVWAAWWASISGG